LKRIHMTEYYDDRPQTADVWYKPHMQNFRTLPESQLPPGVTLGYTYDGFVVNPNDILPWMTAQLRGRGVEFIPRTLSSMQDLRDLTAADVLINATGLGARDLANDPAVHGVRGQTMFVDCATTGKSSLLNQAILHQGSHYTYCIPRSSDGGIILGGVSQPGNTQPQPDRSLRPDILRRVNTITDGTFDWVDLERHGKDIVGFRPAREGGLRVEREGDVVHAYGVGGLGYLYAFGVAKRVRELVDGSVKAKL
jgi:D-amino-acid oxidase